MAKKETPAIPLKTPKGALNHTPAHGIEAVNEAAQEVAQAAREIPPAAKELAKVLPPNLRVYFWLLLVLSPLLAALAQAFFVGRKAELTPETEARMITLEGAVRANQEEIKVDKEDIKEIREGVERIERILLNRALDK